MTTQLWVAWESADTDPNRVAVVWTGTADYDWNNRQINT